MGPQENFEWVPQTFVIDFENTLMESQIVLAGFPKYPYWIPKSMFTRFPTDVQRVSKGFLNCFHMIANAFPNLDSQWTPTESPVDPIFKKNCQRITNGPQEYSQSLTHTVF